MKLQIELKNNNNKELKYNEFEANMLAQLDEISDKLYSLNSDISNYFFDLDESVSSCIEKQIEAMIDSVDNLYLDGIVKSICKRAVVDEFTVDEFEEKFIEFCVDLGVKNTPTLVECALDTFEEQKLTFKNL